MPVDTGRPMTTKPSARTSPCVFFLLVFCLSAPFYFLGAAGGRIPGLSGQPTSALMAFMPMIAALILVYRERGTDEVANLVKRAVACDRVWDKRWYLVAVCLLSIIAVLRYAALRLTGAALPAPLFAFGLIPVFLAMYFVGAIGEELGWHGLNIVALRVIIVWIFVNSGQNIFISILFHTNDRSPLECHCELRAVLRPVYNVGDPVARDRIDHCFLAPTE